MVRALCEESGIPLVMVEKGTDLGQWCGLAKLNVDGTVRKCVKCSCAVITNWGEETAHTHVVLEYIKNQE